MGKWIKICTAPILHVVRFPASAANRRFRGNGEAFVLSAWVSLGTGCLLVREAVVLSMAMDRSGCLPLIDTSGNHASGHANSEPSVSSAVVFVLQNWQV